MSDGENESRYARLTGQPITFLQNIYFHHSPIHAIARIRGSGAGAAGMRQLLMNSVTAMRQTPTVHTMRPFNPAGSPPIQGRKHAGHWVAFGSDREGGCAEGFHVNNVSFVDMTCQPLNAKKYAQITTPGCACFCNSKYPFSRGWLDVQLLGVIL